jgi:hypothetical protein
VRRPPQAQHSDTDLTQSGRSIESEGSGNTMTKYERRRFFERLVELRALYRLRGDDDSVAGLPVDMAIDYGERLMADTPAPAQVPGTDVSRPTR